MDFKKRAEEIFFKQVMPHEIEQALKEAWNEAIQSYMDKMQTFKHLSNSPDGEWRLQCAITFQELKVKQP